VKDIFDVLVEDPSLADRTRLPKSFKSELVFSSDAKEILESCVDVNSVPAASKTPSDVVSVSPVGTEVTVIVSVPEALLGCDIEKVPGVSSLKVNDWLENDKVGVAGTLPLPPPPPPQEASVRAAKLANTSEDLPLSCITCLVFLLFFKFSSKEAFNLSVVFSSNCPRPLVGISPIFIFLF
jgi:hypothetical protein